MAEGDTTSPTDWDKTAEGTGEKLDETPGGIGSTVKGAFTATSNVIAGAASAAGEKVTNVLGFVGKKLKGGDAGPENGK